MTPVSNLQISGGEKWMWNVSKSIKEFQEQELFCDVTLYCGDQVIQAHSLILSACSSFFKMILKKTPRHFHPFIYLSGIKIEDLRSLLKFIYTGTVTVPTTSIFSLLDAAKELQIQGLARGSEEEEQNPPPPPHCEKKRPDLPDPVGHSAGPEEGLPDTAEITSTMEDSRIKQDQYQAHLGYRKRKVNDTDVLVDQNNFEEFERSILSKLWKDVDSENHVVWKCFDCEKASSRKDSMKYHVEKHLDGWAHKCRECDLVYKTRAGLYDHSHRKHKKPQNLLSSI